MLEIVYGETEQRQVASQLADVLTAMQLDGTFYIGYPVIASADEKVLVDALLLTKQHGLIAFRFSGESPRPDDHQAWTQLEDAQNRLFYAIDANLGRHDELRSGRKLGVTVETVTLFPTSPNPPGGIAGRFAGLDEVRDAVKACRPVEDAYLRPLEAALQRVTTIKPRKKRVAVKKETSRGGILKEIEKGIANLDQWQKRAAIETPDGPQRIRGLAGSGKTIVLALKAAYLHSQHPDWTIAITFFTRSLYQQFEDLIRRFSFEHLNDEPNWERLQILHAWGGRGREGIYSALAEYSHIVPRDFGYGRAKYGMDGAFQGICRELLTQTALEPNPPIYDALLIDEAQDMPPEFFRLVYRFTKEPKRIVWAYDELQTLSEAVMPGTADLFGRNDVGEPLVTIQNEPARPRQDVILPVCYRNTPWALTLAHALGFGIYREPKLVQHFDDPNLWYDIGYEVLDGKLQLGSNVTLRRAIKSSPDFFARLLNPEDAVITKSFADEIEQAEWVAESIKKNLTDDELEPDDILIVLPSALTAKRNAAVIGEALLRRQIRSHLVGDMTSVDEIFRPGSVALANIYRSKGNEAPMVYLVNAHTCYGGPELTRKRNTLFTAITRCRAWVRVSGWGESSQLLMQEIQAVRSQGFKLSFRIPSEPELRELRRIHRDLSPEEKKALERDEKQLGSLLDKVLSGELQLDMLNAEIREKVEKLQELARNAGR
ncbi:DNA/RNA helicase, superfamily I (plasmid) [Thioflavicoccus mobilis 8321]|uniref:DNA 3'-5' helicase II n=1 Tax=Thioflavicoccus mobilis 8321 TaxID=765912 RepID=L0H434_9GAMM|nr:ATP-binding domain-containing protein [Thioflavicoccus mobilis]AGA92435.1 DNA/RNA helicase, superfamily I [Thioflavicoccus mobilis 8321]